MAQILIHFSHVSEDDMILFSQVGSKKSLNDVNDSNVILWVEIKNLIWLSYRRKYIL